MCRSKIETQVAKGTAAGSERTNMSCAADIASVTPAAWIIASYSTPIHRGAAHPFNTKVQQEVYGAPPVAVDHQMKPLRRHLAQAYIIKSVPRGEASSDESEWQGSPQLLIGANLVDRISHN